MRIAITGGAGFIGSNLVRYMLAKYSSHDIVVIDKLTYAGNLRNLESVLDHPRFTFIAMDVCNPEICDVVRNCDAVLHLAAESHVDRSIEDAAHFVDTNVHGTWQVLEACRRARVPRMLHVSTDEVYGSLGSVGAFREDTPLAPNSPYAATKAASDLIVLAYVRTHGFPAIVSRCSNNYGPFQFPEKFIPLMIAQAMANQPLPVYGDGRNVRDWIHVLDHCAALDLVLNGGREGEVYNVGGECELENVEVARSILEALARPNDLLKFVTDRPGHDRRYAIDCTKLKDELGWKRTWTFKQGLADTIQWYQSNGEWLEEVRSGTYRAYFDRHYVNRDLLFASGKNT
jgi:dTDP-glucose 4,6-dehydratase